MENQNPLSKFFISIAEKILSAVEYQLKLEKYLSNPSQYASDIAAISEKFYSELETENYVSSWANPEFAANNFKSPLSGLLSTIYYHVFELPLLAAMRRNFEIQRFIDFVGAITLIKKDNNLDSESLDAYDLFLSEYKTYRLDVLKPSLENVILRIYGNKLSPFEKIIAETEIFESDSLYTYGEEVSHLDKNYFEFMRKQKDAIDKQAEIFVKAFIEGLVRNDTKAELRSNIRLEFTMGQEPFVIAIKKALSKKGYNGYVSDITRIPANRQVAYDHKFDDALIFDQEYADSYISYYEELMNKYKHLVDNYLGIMCVESFGESPFSPENKPSNIKMSATQNNLMRSLNSRKSLIKESIIPSENYSFCLLSLPTIHIGEKLEEIFNATCQINAMANEDYEGVQQLIVDAVDKGEYIIVKGCGLNETDISVSLPPLEDSLKQSNFVNCVSEVNVPIGEVFTSPKLLGTHGILHLPEIYLYGYMFKNLRLTFVDGMVTDYSCTNFENVKENKDFISENLLYPYETLPMGEFAIGTNTLAYVLSKKLDITNVLPVLIIEKMGPHFAIGDTCFSHIEDVPFYNFFDGKEVTARDNEYCKRRFENPAEGYTSVHTDITIPYDEIGLIAAVTASGETINIIENGRFVLDGTEKLNEPFALYTAEEHE